MKRTLAAFALPALGMSAPPVRIESMEIVRVPVNRRGGWVLVRVRTDQGVTGVGDASHGRDEVVIANLRTLFAQIKGKPFTSIEALRKAAQPLVGKADRMSGATALSGIEQALWDIAGKVFGVPTRELFGGTLQTRLRNYANINRATFDRSPAGFAKWAEHAVRNGFDAIKLASFDGMPKDPALKEAHTRNGIACIEAVRKVGGDKIDVLVDAHSNFTVERGIQLGKELEPLRLFWLEEVIRGIQNLAKVNAAVPMPTAGGESLYGVREFFPYIAGKAVDIAMPDVKYCGGMLELKKISAMVEGAGLPIAPHGPASPIGNVAAGQVCATLPNFQILEFGYGEVEWRAEIVDPPERMEKGYLTLSDKPGFGLDFNDKVMQKRGQVV
jgi:galactonate dehydratase